MNKLLLTDISSVNKSRTEAEISAKMEQFHFSVQPLWKLGNWLPTLLRQWECVDHNCGYDQVLIQADSIYLFVISHSLHRVIIYVLHIKPLWILIGPSIRRYMRHE